MTWFSGTHNRRPPRTCEVCGNTAPLDAIRLRGGRFYCPRGDCRREAERLIQEARGRLEAAEMASKRGGTTMAVEKDVQDRLAKLPRRAAVAVAARCARRVQPLTHELPQQNRDAIDRAIAVAEAFANGDVGNTGTGAGDAAAGAARDAWTDAAAAGAAGAATWASWGAAAAAAWGAAEAARGATDATDAAQATEATGATWAAAASDLDRLSALNLGPPDSLGPTIDPSEAGPLGLLWPQGVPQWLT